MMRYLSPSTMLFPLFLAGLRAWGAPAGAEDLGAELRARITNRTKKMYAFESWRAAEKSPGRGIGELPSLAPFLKEKYGRARAIGAMASRWRQVVIEVCPEKGRATRTALLAEVCESPYAAKERVVQMLGATSMPGPVFSRAKPGSPEDRGDVCFFGRSRSGKVSVIFFARSNAFVDVSISIPGGDSRVLDIATEADSMLVDHLRDMKFPLKMDDGLHRPVSGPPSQ